jgi:hypothetical protein
MEVHAHTHTARKKWTHYLWEFLMLFLAVFCGFLAENQREHLSDRSKEKEYMRSMVQDLESDTAIDALSIQFFTNVFKNVDTMLTCLKSDAPDPTIIHRIILRNFWTYGGYSYNNRTIEQLKNAGNFRLIQNNAVADSILEFDNYMNTVLGQHNALLNSMISYKEVEEKVIHYKELKQSGSSYMQMFDSSDFVHTNAPAFISSDKELISLYYNKLFYHERLGHVFVRNLKDAVNRATRLLLFIKKEYHLK